MTADYGMPSRYGGKCHLCADLAGPTHDVEPTGWLSGVRCARCRFCQERALSRATARAGLGAFSPEVRRATHAFQRGEGDPLLDQLRAEIQDTLPPNDGGGA